MGRRALQLTNRNSCTKWPTASESGTSYRSAIFYSDEAQRKIATEYIAQLDAARVFHHPIVTQVVPLKGFYDAEYYHQDYALHHPDNPYILVCDRPKVEALRKEFPDLLQEYTGR